MTKRLEVTEMFRDMIKLGHITPAETMEDLRFPGELPYVPTIATYGTYNAPINVGTGPNAQLDQRTQGNFS
ncbi:hypothetical protein ACXHXM_25945